MSKIIYFSDLHLRHKIVDEVLSWETDYDKVIFANDIFDQFGDTPEQNGVAAAWLKEKINDPRNIFLYSNHTVSYTWPQNPWAYCSGFDPQKAREIYKNITKVDLLKQKIAWAEDGIIYSHAGFHRDWFAYVAKKGYAVPTQLTYEVIAEWLPVIQKEVEFLYDVGRSHPIFEAATNRGGDHKIGGCIWEDWHSFVHIPGFGQCVGHSPLKLPQFMFKNQDLTPRFRFVGRHSINSRYFAGGWALNMDTHTKHYAIIHNDTITINEINYLPQEGIILKGKTLCEVKYQ